VTSRLTLRKSRRQLSGAVIRISNCDDREAAAAAAAANGTGHAVSLDRTITMTGSPESVALAQYLINMR